jgi:hypothetical protein
LASFEIVVITSAFVISFTSFFTGPVAPQKKRVEFKPSIFLKVKSFIRTLSHHSHRQQWFFRALHSDEGLCQIGALFRTQFLGFIFLKSYRPGDGFRNRQFVTDR